MLVLNVRSVDVVDARVVLNSWYKFISSSDAGRARRRVFVQARSIIFHYWHFTIFLRVYFRICPRSSALT